MDRTTASYYRSILFRDPEDQRPLPPSLVRMHTWAFKACQYMGIGSIISKQIALSLALNWLASTVDGRAFAREHTDIGDLFCPSDESEDAKQEGVKAEQVKFEGETQKAAIPQTELDPTQIDWNAVAPLRKVVVTVGEEKTEGVFMARRGVWLDINIGTETKPFQMSQVKLIGV